MKTFVIHINLTDSFNRQECTPSRTGVNHFSYLFKSTHTNVKFIVNLVQIYYTSQFYERIKIL